MVYITGVPSTRSKGGGILSSIVFIDSEIDAENGKILDLGAYHQK